MVREHTLNFPIGLANNVFFVVLFWNARLYADVGLQVVFFALGVFGWWNWCYGGKDKSELVVTKTNKTEWVIILFFVVLGVWGLRHLLILVNGAAPFWDAVQSIADKHPADLYLLTGDEIPFVQDGLPKQLTCPLL